MILFCGIANGEIKKGYVPSMPESGKIVVMYAEWATDFNSTGVAQPTDFNDANTVFFADNQTLTFNGFRGMLCQIKIDPNGSDSSFTVGIYYDPTEPESVGQTAKIYTLKEWTINAADTNDLKYVVPSLDASSNVYGGDVGYSKIYLGIKNTTHETLDNCKIYLYGKLE